MLLSPLTLFDVDLEQISLVDELLLEEIDRAQLDVPWKREGLDAVAVVRFPSVLEEVFSLQRSVAFVPVQFDDGEDVPVPLSLETTL